MKDFFVFDGRRSTDFGVYIATGNYGNAPSRDVEIIEVPGRNGSLCLDNGRYKNAEHRYTLYVPEGGLTNLGGLRDWLMTRNGYCRLEDTINPDEYYLARFVTEFKVEKSDRIRSATEVIFDRQPQRFLKSGDLEHTFTGSGVLYNRYQSVARPLVRAYGTGSFALNGTTVGITSASVYTDIDCDIEEAYKGSVSKNDCITLSAGLFPTLTPGENQIRMSGLTRLVITPRWWRI